MSKITTFGDRVAVEIIEEAKTGLIELPQSRFKMFMFGKVLASSAQSGSLVAKPGDQVFFQIAPTYMTDTVVDEKKTVLVHSGDILGTVKTPTLDFGGLTAAGGWVFIEVFHTTKLTSGILLPDTAAPVEAPKFKVVKTGPDVKNVKVGDEVVIDRARLNPITLAVKGKAEEFGYISHSFIAGLIQSDNPTVQRVE